VSRVHVPGFIHEVIDDPRQRGILISGCLSLFAVGLVPRVLLPSLPNAQELIKAEPEVANLFLLLSFISAAMVIAGGVVSDIFRRRSLLLGGLVAMFLGAAVGVFIDHGPIYYLVGFVTVAAGGLVLAYGIGAVAIAYEGIPRATALGFVYAAFGAAAAVAPLVLTLFPELVPDETPGGPPRFGFETSPAYLLAAIGAAVAIWAARRWMPALPGTLPASRTLITAVAVWAISILAIVSGLVSLGGPAGTLLPIVLIVLGAIGLGTLTIRLKRTRQLVAGLDLDVRGMGAALVVGVAVGFAQVVPLILLPSMFQYALDYGAFFAMLAIAPFAIALLLAGPVSGILIHRYGPRGMMALGTLMVGGANIGLALILARSGIDSQYAAFVVPLILIGAGFVVSTTVRTAIVFAATPRGLPASAAGINQASVALGSRLGIVAGTAAMATAAVASARTIVEGRPDAEALVEEFRAALVSLGTPGFQAAYQASLEGASEAKEAAYAVAYVDGVVLALVIGGVVGVVGALIAWFLTGRRDPLHAVFDMQDERQPDTVQQGA